MSASIAISQDSVRHAFFREPVLTEFYPFGIPIEVDCAEPGVIDAVREAVAGSEGAIDPNARRLRLEFGIDDELWGTGPSGIHIEGQELWLAGPGVLCIADAVTGQAECALSRDFVDDPELLQGSVLDPLLLFLIARSGRAPIHAAGLVAGGRAILLAGPSGIGKSCLAQAAVGAGFTVLSDDIVFAEPAPSLRVWGMPRPIHLFKKDAPAAADGVLRLRNGKIKRAVPIPCGRHAASAEGAALCILARGEQASLTPITAGDAMESFGRLDRGFDLLETEIRASVAALARRGAWRLCLSDDPADAVRLLRDNLQGLTAPTQ